MAMEPNIKGVPISRIASISGLPMASIKNIAGIDTIKIPSWPGNITCDTLLLGGGRTFEDACRNWYDGLVNNFSFDATNEILYMYGFCGDNTNMLFTPPGGLYLTDGVVVWLWEATVESHSWTLYNDYIEPIPRLLGDIQFYMHFATNGYPISQLYLITSVNPVYDPMDKRQIYLAQSSESTDGGETWNTIYLSPPDGFSVDKRGNPIGFTASNISVAQVQGEEQGGVPSESLFQQNLYQLILYPIFNDATTYAKIVINAGDTLVVPSVISIEEYYQGTLIV